MAGAQISQYTNTSSLHIRGISFVSSVYILFIIYRVLLKVLSIFNLEYVYNIVFVFWLNLHKTATSFVTLVAVNRLGCVFDPFSSFSGQIEGKNDTCFRLRLNPYL